MDCLTRCRQWNVGMGEDDIQVSSISADVECVEWDVLLSFRCEAMVEGAGQSSLLLSLSYINSHGVDIKMYIPCSAHRRRT